jgi:hypothetical protein
LTITTIEAPATSERALNMGVTRITNIDNGHAADEAGSSSGCRRTYEVKRGRSFPRRFFRTAPDTQVHKQRSRSDLQSKATTLLITRWS